MSRGPRTCGTAGLALIALGLAITGCDRTGDPAGDAAGDAVTFEDVAPILHEHCAVCHHPGASGPFDLLTYDDARRRARQIADVTRSRYMPPWLPEAGNEPLAAARRLTEEQIGRLARWAEAGAPPGAAARTPEPPRFADGWQLGTPDLVVTLPQPYPLRADGPDDFRNFVITPPVETMRYVRAMEFQPGNPRVVHHAVVYADRSGSARRADDADPGPGFGGMDVAEVEIPDGHFLGWTPGRVPHPGFDGIAWRLRPGTDLVVQLHLQPSGKPEVVQPRIGLHFTDEPPRRALFHISLRDDFIIIPPGARDYTIEDRYELPVDVHLLTAYPHAHYLGKDLRLLAEEPDGTTRELLHIPDWDFNWQDQYRFADTPLLLRGTTLVMRYAYDNSSANPRNPFDPPREVRYGLQSTDEMGTLGLQVLPRRPEDLPMLAADMRRKTQRRKAELYERMLPRMSDRPSIFHALGEAYRVLGELEAAETAFRRAVALDDTFADGHDGLGVIRQLDGAHEEAVVHFHRALELEPDHANARYNLANSLLALERPEEAVTELQMVIAIDPGRASAHYNLGVILQGRGNVDGAMARYRRTIDLEPDHAKAQYNLGLLLGRSRRFDEAITHLARAVAIDPSLVEARFRLAVALEMSGRRPEAADQYRIVLQQRPNHAEARRGLERTKPEG